MKTYIIIATLFIAILGTASYIAWFYYSESSGWHTEETSGFSVSLPPGWQLEEKQGIDSAVGEITGDGITLTYDFGWYTADPRNDSDDENILSETIDSREAFIVLPKAEGDVMAVFFPDVEETISSWRMVNEASAIPIDSFTTTSKFGLRGQNIPPEKEDIILRIFRSIQFNS
ncbi:hypothetical protein ACFL2D_02025 [Patescibacteria group bacterium]